LNNHVKPADALEALMLREPTSEEWQ